jgi:hypothetical protein
MTIRRHNCRPLAELRALAKITLGNNHTYRTMCPLMDHPPGETSRHRLYAPSEGRGHGFAAYRACFVPDLTSGSCHGAIIPTVRG